MDIASIATLGCEPCGIEPLDIRNKLDADQKTIIELLCMHWTLTHLRALAGGFSGSLLFVAEGWKGAARTEPMVLKVDDITQMRRELDGYHQVKDFFGKHVPTFGYPVIQGDLGLERVGWKDYVAVNLGWTQSSNAPGQASRPPTAARRA